jgi:hypothetical protein
MPKKMIDGAQKSDRPTFGDGAPPLLSEKLIAQLQGAVEAAQRKRTPAEKQAMDVKGSFRPFRKETGHPT